MNSFKNTEQLFSNPADFLNCKQYRSLDTTGLLETMLMVDKMEIELIPDGWKRTYSIDGGCFITRDYLLN